MSGCVIAAPSSGSGKTTITLGLLRALKNRGISIASGKAGPDFIDPQFHAIASGAKCYNFDPWAMRPELLIGQKNRLQSPDNFLLIEAMMGLFDGAADGTGSAGDLAALLNLPVILVVDCSKLSHSVAAIVSGFAHFRDDVHICGVILNKVASTRHEKMLRGALSSQSIEIFGAIHRDDRFKLPERHLGLVQAGEHLKIEQFIEDVASHIEQNLDMQRIIDVADSKHSAQIPTVNALPPIAQNIAVASDMAFSFSYEHILTGWRDMGAELSFFSPLNDQTPSQNAKAIYLPGGYPELYAEKLSNCTSFRSAMRKAANEDKLIYGECGGYMVLGERLIDAHGVSHPMLGLLPLETSFASRKRQLGYRKLHPKNNLLWDGPLRGHEFHYSTVHKADHVEPLFSAGDAEDNALGDRGMRVGHVAGSYMHVVDRA
ncbi:cobyrinate a,c-diamide synthase [Lentilitoribacter sp. Alg239-R112]|uniref:cobyrinate a,c-diamide synthase n=1 Tax=Lentilitoribacter sp. Alg239-R112 TaxID=2305987 RepID=UPI0013A6E08E|nr:cobyrinate a,c-diamide synthase [Lentilitoribacter sp. Alg239-R112]